MQKKFLIALSALFFPAVTSLTVCAADQVFDCSRLSEKAGGEQVRYSLEATVNGPVFFNGISCGIRYRNKELCAMEMVSFDTSGAVYDYATGEKIEIGKAYFRLDEKNPAFPILAFGSKEAAERYNAENPGGVVLDYSGLTETMLK